VFRHQIPWHPVSKPKLNKSTMNEIIISTILSYFVGIASSLRTDAILTSQKEKVAARLRQHRPACVSEALHQNPA